MGNYAFSKREGGEKGKFFCSPHYRQLFLSHPEAINYTRAREQTKEGASNQQPSTVVNKDEKVDIRDINTHLMVYMYTLHTGCRDCKVITNIHT